MALLLHYILRGREIPHYASNQLHFSQVLVIKRGELLLRMVNVLGAQQRDLLNDGIAQRLKCHVPCFDEMLAFSTS